MIYITFDNYYGVNEYNSFINSAKNNGVEVTEWINIRPPYNWFVGLMSESNLPKFVDYDIATTSQEKWLIKKIDPLVNKDDYLLIRRENDGETNFSKFVLNDYLTEMYQNKKVFLFRYKNREELINISNNIEMKDSKIYMLGTYKNWNIAFCTNPYIMSHISTDWVLYSTQNESDFNKIGEIEAYINYYVLRTTKISKKHFNTKYVMNGRYFPVIQSS